MTILVACGLKREAAIARRAGFGAVAGGGDAERLARKLRAEIDEGSVHAVLSSGLAGALDPRLKAGDVVVGLLYPGEGRGTVVHKLRALLSDAVEGMVTGSDIPVASVEAKRALFADTGALAVDMESHIAARVAAEHDLPFAILRAISDDAGHALPEAALVGMKPDGGMAVGAVIAALLRDPRQLPALLRTARDAERAFRALARAYDVLGRTGICLTDLG